MVVRMDEFMRERRREGALRLEEVATQGHRVAGRHLEVSSQALWVLMRAGGEAEGREGRGSGSQGARARAPVTPCEHVPKATARPGAQVSHPVGPHGLMRLTCRVAHGGMHPELMQRAQLAQDLRDAGLPQRFFKRGCAGIGPEGGLARSGRHAGGGCAIRQRSACVSGSSGEAGPPLTEGCECPLPPKELCPPAAQRASRGCPPSREFAAPSPHNARPSSRTQGAGQPAAEGSRSHH